MSTTDRVLITGLGFLTPLGQTNEAISGALRQTRTAVRELTGRDYSAMPARFGAEIDPALVEAHRLDPIKFKRFNQYVKYGVIATRNALIDAGLLRDGEFDGRYAESRRGVFVSTGVNGENAEGLFDGFAAASAADGSLDRKRFAAAGIDLVNPRWILTTISNNLIFFLTSEFGLKGDNNNVTYSAVGGCYMLDAAMDALTVGACDVAVVTGSDSLINWQAQDDLARSGLFRDDPLAPEARAMTPFTRGAAGALPGEGAACLVLERESSAVARGAKGYARVLAVHEHCSGSDLLSPSPDGVETREVLTALLRAGVGSGDLLINLNGMAAPAWDRSELAGVASALRDPHSVSLNITPICTSSKPYFCHTFSSAFVLDAAAAVLSLHEGFVFPLPVPPDLPGTDGLFGPGVTPSSHPFAIALGHGLGGNAGGVLLGRV